MAMSVFRAAARSSSDSAFHSDSTDSAMRNRSFPKELLRQHHRAAARLLFRQLDAVAQLGIIGDGDRFAQRHVLVVRDEDGHSAAIPLEDGLAPGQLTLADELSCVRRKIEYLQPLWWLFHRRTIPAGMF